MKFRKLEKVGLVLVIGLVIAFACLNFLKRPAVDSELKQRGVNADEKPSQVSMDYEGGHEMAVVEHASSRHTVPEFEMVLLSGELRAFPIAPKLAVERFRLGLSRSVEYGVPFDGRASIDSVHEAKRHLLKHGSWMAGVFLSYGCDAGDWFVFSGFHDGSGSSEAETHPDQDIFKYGFGVRKSDGKIVRWKALEKGVR